MSWHLRSDFILSWMRKDEILFKKYLSTYSRNTCPPVQEILVHLFKKYLSTCLLAYCPLEPIPQQRHPKQAPFQKPKKIFSLFSVNLSKFSLLKIVYLETAYLSFLQIFGVIKERGMSICQFVKTPRRPQKCQVFPLLHGAPEINN